MKSQKIKFKLFLPLIENTHTTLSTKLLYSIISTFILAIIGIQIFLFNLSYDEAYTYLAYAKYDKFFNIFALNLANNHVLNSLLIYFSSLFAPFSILAIRLPIFIFAIIYFIISAIVSSRFRNQLLCFGLLTCYYFFIQHFTVARGYGMAATIELFGFLFLTLEKDKLKNNFTSIVFLIVACCANLAAFSILIALLTYLWLFEYDRKFIVFSKKRNIFLSLSFLIISLSFFIISKDGKPLFGAYNESFTEAVTLFYLQTLIPFIKVPLFIAYVIEFLFIAYIIYMIFRSANKSKFGIILFINFTIIYLSGSILHKPFPTARVLIPYWPLIVFAIIEFIELLSIKLSISKSLIMLLNILCLIILIYSYCSSITFKENIFKDPQVMSLEYDVQSDLNISPYFINELRPDIEFYLKKGKFYNTIPTNLSKIKPDTIINTKNETIRFYKEKKIISIYLSEQKKETEYSYNLNFENDSSSKNLLINTDLFEYKLNDSICRIIVLPNGIKLLSQVQIFNNNILNKPTILF